MCNLATVIKEGVRKMIVYLNNFEAHLYYFSISCNSQYAIADIRIRERIKAKKFDSYILERH